MVGRFDALDLRPWYWLPRVLYDAPSHVGLDLDLSEIASSIYGFLLVITMLLRPQGRLLTQVIEPRRSASAEALAIQRLPSDES